MKLVPAGVSRKSGKPYNAFWSCKCGKTAREGGYQNAPAERAVNYPQMLPQQSACNCEERFANVSKWKIRVEERLAELDKRLKSIETWQEGANPKARALHSAYDGIPVIDSTSDNMELVNAAASILGGQIDPTK